MSIVGHFVAPFWLLLRQAGRRREIVIAIAGAGILKAHLADISWLVLPAFPHRTAMWWPVTAALLLVGGGGAAVAAWRSKGISWVPVGDPGLDPDPGTTG